jgi:hypothetical protein
VAGLALIGDVRNIVLAGKSHGVADIAAVLRNERAGAFDARGVDRPVRRARRRMPV